MQQIPRKKEIKNNQEIQKFSGNIEVRWPEKECKNDLSCSWTG